MRRGQCRAPAPSFSSVLLIMVRAFGPLNRDMAVAARQVDEYLEQVDCLECGGSGFERATESLTDTDAYGELSAPFASMRFNFVRCTHCATVYLRERVSQAHIAHFYNAEYHCYRSFDERGFIFRWLSRLLTRSKLRTIERLFPTEQRRLLDFGCGTGTWLELLRRSGVRWELIGTEISDAQVQRVRSLGVRGHVCDHRTVGQFVAAGSVGVAHLFHVIEHLPDPIEALDALRKLLEPGGAIFGQTPNIESWDCRMFGRYWSQWHVPRHLVMYSPDQLARHAKAAGLEVEFIGSSLVSATNWAASLQKWWALRRNRTYGGLQSGSLYPLLTVGMIPLTLVQSLLSQTSDIDFVLRRPLCG